MSRVSRPDASRRLVVALLALLLVAAGRVSSEEERPLFLHFRERVKAAGAAGGFSVVEKTVVWQPSRTALIICDMWDRHWCQGASRRVAGMAKRMNRVVQAARERGVFVIHAPSDTMDSYRDTPQRRLAREAPRAENLPAGIDSWCSLESRKEAALPIDDSDGGCDCQPRCKSHRAWSRQIESIDIAPGDAISDRGSEIWNLLEARDIDNVCLLGVHTNMCVLGRPFGVRSLVKNGKNVALVRDLTDSMYNPRKPPFVHHRRGTEFVIQHIEKYWCPTVLSRDIVGKAPKPHVVFVVAEREYETRKTLPEFARNVLGARHGLRYTFLHVNPGDPWDIPGLEVLDDADALVLSVRRRALPEKQLAAIRRYLEAGKPLVAIRTSSHAFDTRGAVRERPGYADWPAFDTEVLGGDYEGHHGGQDASESTFVWRLDAARSHPILRGVSPGELKVRSWLYKTRPLAETATPLMMGRAGDRKPHQPVAWTNTYRGGRIFYTSLGHPDDFRDKTFQRLLANAVLWALEREVPGPAR